jgi:hypothetical protein
MSTIKKKKKSIVKKNTNIFDYVIIGAGISGLYAAHRIRQHADPNARILILEAGCRIGGRMAMVDFHGVMVEPGAGIGRLEKDHALRELLEELGIKWSEFPVTHNYSPSVYDSELANDKQQAKEKKRIVKLGRAAQKIEVPMPSHGIQTPDWIKKQVTKLRAAYKKMPAATTFHAFAQKVLGYKGYQQLVLALGYTDFEKEDVRETLFNYGLDDLYEKWTGMGIDWQTLMNSLVEHAYADIRLSTRVIRITRDTQPTDDDSSPFFTIQTSHVPNPATNSSTQKSNARTRTIPATANNSIRKTHKNQPLRLGLTRQNIPNLATSNSIGCEKSKTKKNHKGSTTHEYFKARKVLIATSIGPARELVSDFMLGEGLRVPVHLSGVQAQSFIRIYGYFTGKNQEIMQEYVKHTQVVPGRYHRVIPMGSSDGGKSGVYMIVYTDNRAADDLEHLSANTPINRQLLATGLKAALGIPVEIPLEITEILGYYWREGTHYYTPLNQRKFGTRDKFLYQLQRPLGVSGGIFMAGEAFSRQQGWTEGALESVDLVLEDLL